MYQLTTYNLPKEREQIFEQYQNGNFNIDWSKVRDENHKKELEDLIEKVQNQLSENTFLNYVNNETIFEKIYHAYKDNLTCYEKDYLENKVNYENSYNNYLGFREHLHKILKTELDQLNEEMKRRLEKHDYFTNSLIKTDLVHFSEKLENYVAMNNKWHSVKQTYIDGLENDKNNIWKEEWDKRFKYLENLDSKLTGTELPSEDDLIPYSIEGIEKVKHNDIKKYSAFLLDSIVTAGKDMNIPLEVFKEFCLVKYDKLDLDTPQRRYILLKRQFKRVSGIRNEVNKFGSELRYKKDFFKLVNNHIEVRNKKRKNLLIFGAVIPFIITLFSFFLELRLRNSGGLFLLISAIAAICFLFVGIPAIIRYKNR